MALPNSGVIALRSGAVLTYTASKCNLRLPLWFGGFDYSAVLLEQKGL